MSTQVVRGNKADGGNRELTSPFSPFPPVLFLSGGVVSIWHNGQIRVVLFVHWLKHQAADLQLAVGRRQDHLYDARLGQLHVKRLALRRLIRFDLLRSRLIPSGDVQCYVERKGVLVRARSLAEQEYKTVAAGQQLVVFAVHQR